LSPDSHLHFSYLRIDQTGVELPGQAFDISYLSTDAYGVDYVLENQPAYDQLTASAWYNRTRLIGDAQRPGKRRQFPFLDAIQFVGNTDVDATSTGYRLATAWESPDDWRLIVGTDLRFVNQELNEIISGQSGINRFIDVNSPIPDSDWVNPGIFVQHQWYATDQWSFRVGARADEVATRIVDDPSKLAEVGTTGRPYAEIVGTTVEDRSLGLWAAFASANYQPVEDWSISLQMGRAERAPSLTELYVAQSFMFLIQNGLNTITGDPLLRAEKLWQMDITLAHQGDRLHGVVRGFHNWVHDYITYENLGIVENDDDEREQVNLKYVNTNLATFTGVEMLADYRWTDGLTPFGTLQYVRAQDLTRNGDFATRQASFVRPSTRDYTRNRGAFGGAPTNAAEEPLPQISPLQSKLGIRLHSPDPIPWWAIEIYARVVGPQNRVAVSLHESPTAGFAVGDIRAYLRPSDSWIVVGGIENFTDRNYREHLDFRSEGRGLTVFQPGINFYSGVELRY
jgi:iron complex outermembrane recepter protein